MRDEHLPDSRPGRLARAADDDGTGGDDEATVTTAALVEHVADRALAAAPRAGSTRVVAVDGPSGSGKSTLGSALVVHLPDAALVRMDDLYPGWDGLRDSVPRLLEWVLEPLSRNDPARYRRFDWVEGRYAEWHQVPRAGVVVVEGVGAGARACAPLLSLLVWAEAPRDLRFARGIARDGESYRPHWQRWAVQEAAMFEADATRERADVLVGSAVPGRWQLLPAGTTSRTPEPPRRPRR